MYCKQAANMILCLLKECVYIYIRKQGKTDYVGCFFLQQTPKSIFVCSIEQGSVGVLCDIDVGWIELSC